MSEPNLIDFLMTVINGIEYGSISTTNRAYQWMKNNSSLNGPCLSYLKNYVTRENFVTQKELELFKKLKQGGNLSSEEEIDKQLEEYFDNAEINEFEFDNLQHYSEILKHGDSYLRELNLADKFLRRKQNELEVKIKAEERKKELNESEVKNIFQRSDEVNDLYNEILKSIQCELLKITLKFDGILKENLNQEEHNIFHINFEIFKQINKTFLDTVRVVMEKQFSNTKRNADLCPSNRAGFETDDRKHIQTLIQVAHCFGERSFENIQYQCEEVEHQQLISFVTNLMQDVENKPPSIVGSAQLQSQAATNLETVEEIQGKLLLLSKNLEQYFKNYLVYEIFTDERNRIESKLKSDKKRLRKVLDLCVRFVDLLTLQAFLLENEKENVDLAIDLHQKAISTLDHQLALHSDCVSGVEKLLQNTQMKKSNINALAKCGANLLAMDLDSDENLSVEKVLQKFSNASNEILDKIRTLVDKKLTTIGMLKNNIDRLDAVVFSGPARQPFFRGSLLVDKRLIESQCSEFNKVFRALKKDYKDELEKLSTDEYSKIEKSLWMMFLTDPQNLQVNLQKLRDKAGVNKTLIMKKNESSSSLAQKTNRSTYY